MTGREPKKDNDLFYLCSLIEHIAHRTKNRNRVVVNKIGEDRLLKIFRLADVYHSDNLDKVADAIDNYNSSFYYTPSEGIYQSYLAGEVVD